MKNIFVPTDFSDCADHALKVAVYLAKRFDAEITLYHHCNLPLTDSNIPGPVMKEMMEELQKRGEEESSKRAVMLRNEGVKHRTIIGTDLIFIDSVLRKIREAEADLVVAGTTGVSGLAERIVGSNAEKILQKAACDVLLVPEQASVSISGILFGFDFEANDLVAALKIAGLAETVGVPVHIVHVETDEHVSEKDRLAFEKFKEDILSTSIYKNITFNILKGQRIAHILEEYARTQDTNVIALTAREKGTLSRFLQPGVSRSLAWHAKMPVYAVHTH